MIIIGVWGQVVMAPLYYIHIVVIRNPVQNHHRKVICSSRGDHWPFHYFIFCLLLHNLSTTLPIQDFFPHVTINLSFPRWHGYEGSVSAQISCPHRTSSSCIWYSILTCIWVSCLRAMYGTLTIMRMGGFEVWNFREHEGVSGGGR